MINNFLGIDTSNYTTSLAIYDKETVTHSKKLLPVKKGELGLRQSDAVFHHTKQLPDLMQSLAPKDIKAIGVSSKPRSLEGSYMPCFLVGLAHAKVLATALNVPMFEFSHQQGHIVASLFSSNRMDLMEKDFIAFHLSGGTSEAVLVKNGVLGEIEIISKSLDLNAGQAIDRAGVMLGLNFPCGKEIDKLANECDEKIKIKPSVKELDFCLSGTENKCKKLFEENYSKEYIAKFCLEYIIASLDKVIMNIKEKYKDLPIVFSGGVSSNSLMQKRFKEKYNASFATPDFSCDNAGGIAILAEHSMNK